MNAELKKFLLFMGICAYIVGVLGTFGWLIYHRAWVILAGAVVVAVIAFPKALSWLKELTNG